MKIKAFMNVGLILVAVLFSYAVVNAQDQTSDKTTANQAPMPKHQVVVTDNLAKPETAGTAASVTSQPKTSTKKIGNYNISVTDNVQGQSMENGKYFMVTTWDGTKWVTKRTWMPNKPGASTSPTPPNQ